MSTDAVVISMPEMQNACDLRLFLESSVKTLLKTLLLFEVHCVHKVFKQSENTMDRNIICHSATQISIMIELSYSFYLSNQLFIM